MKKQDGQELTDKEWYQLSNTLMDIADQTDQIGADSDNLETGSENAKGAVRSYLTEHGFTAESTDKFINGYESWVSDLQERQKHDNFYEMPLVRVTADALKDASDSKYIKYTINGVDYITDGLHIIRSNSPGDTAYAWVVGAETAYIVGNTLNIGGKYIGLMPKSRLVGSGILGGLAGNAMQDKLENELQKEHDHPKRETSDEKRG